MSAWLTVLRVALGVVAYMAFALAASWAIRRSGRELKAMEVRTAPHVVAVGAAANLGILGASLVLLRVALGRPVADLGLSFARADLGFSAGAAALLALLALAWVLTLARAGVVEVEARSPADGGVSAMLAVWLLLLLVALAEEVLFRGYMTMSLRPLGPFWIVVASTVIFAAIHVPTNRVSVHQMLGWLIGGAVLEYAYLATGTLWVPILLHFATDMINVLVFDIVGRSSALRITPRLTAGHRAAYRVVYAVALVAMLVAVYGPGLDRGP